MNQSRAIPKVALLSSFGAKAGFRFINRGIALAEAMQRLRVAEPTFLLDKESPQGARVLGTGNDVLPLGASEDGDFNWEDVASAVRTIQADAVVIDLEGGPDVQAVADLVDRNCVVILMNSFGEANFRAHLTVFQTPQIARTIGDDPRWSESPFGFVEGPEWIVLRPNFRRAKMKRAEPRQLRLLISMGEKDPDEATGKILSHLERIDFDFRMTPVLGPLFEGDLARIIAGVRRKVDVARAVPDMASLMDNHDLAFVSYGNTAFELASRGVPSILVSHTIAEEEAARAFSDLGGAAFLGSLESGLGGIIELETNRILKDRALRIKMGEAGPKAIDGRGADRVALKISECLGD